MNGHLRFLHFLRNKELNELYASVAIRAFALSMISIFIPIYLLKLDYSLSSVLFFYVVLNGVHALFAIPAAKISSKFGSKHTILFSVPLLIAFYALLYSIESYQWPLYLLAVFSGVSLALFWIGYHTDFAKFSDTKERAQEVGFAKIFSSAAQVAGPLTGGIILTFGGFKILFVVVSLLLIASIIPLFFSKDIHEPFDFSVKQIFMDQKIRDYLAFAGHGMETGVGFVIWPIFIFFSILNSFTTLGFVVTLSLLFSMVITFKVSKLSDIWRKLVLRIGSLLNTVVWGLRALAVTSLHVFIIDALYGMTKTAIMIPFAASFYDKANKSNAVEYITFGEIMMSVGRMMLFVLMLFITDLTVGFIFGGVGSLLYMFF